MVCLIWYGLGYTNSSLYGLALGYTNPAYMVWLKAIHPAYMVWLRAIQIQLIWYALALYKSSLYGLA